MAAIERFVGPVGAALIGLVGMFHLDHIGAEHGQLIGRKRARQNMGDVDYRMPSNGRVIAVS